MQPLIRYSDFWQDQAANSDIELYSTLSIKRNIESLPFPAQMSIAEKGTLLSLCRDIIPPVTGFAFESDEPERRSLFIEQSLCGDSERTFEKILTGAPSAAITVQGSSHLSIYHAFADGKFYSAFNTIDVIDDRVGETIKYAFRERFGFLFENPAECGTGFSARTLLHLPALSISNAREEAKSLCGEFETELAPYQKKDSLPLYVLSSRSSFSDSEQDLCANMQGAIAALSRFEQEAKDNHRTLRFLQLEDLVWRSYGLLSNCRMISWEEAAEYLLNLRFGIDLGIFPNFNVKILNSLIFETSDSFLSCFDSDEKTDTAILRADLIRRAMHKR